MSEEFHDMIQHLGEAINDAVLESESVTASLEQIRDSGVEIFLVLEATICVRRHDGASVETPTRALEPVEVEEEEFEISPEDRHFLQRLRIKVSDED